MAFLPVFHVVPSLTPTDSAPKKLRNCGEVGDGERGGWGRERWMGRGAEEGLGGVRGERRSRTRGTGMEQSIGRSASIVFPLPPVLAVQDWCSATCSATYVAETDVIKHGWLQLSAYRCGQDFLDVLCLHNCHRVPVKSPLGYYPGEDARARRRWSGGLPEDAAVELEEVVPGAEGAEGKGNGTALRNGGKDSSTFGNGVKEQAVEKEEEGGGQGCAQDEEGGEGGPSC